MLFVTNLTWNNFTSLKTVKRMLYLDHVWGARVGRWWEHSPPTNVARVQIPPSTPYVGWVCCWFSPLLREVFLRVLRFSPLLKNQHLQIPIRSGTCFVGKKATTTTTKSNVLLRYVLIYNLGVSFNMFTACSVKTVHFLTLGYFVRAPDNSNCFRFPLKVWVIGNRLYTHWFPASIFIIKQGRLINFSHYIHVFCPS